MITSLLPAGSLAQAPATSGVTIATRSELVSVPVVVADKTGAHIRGLKKEDFRLLEEGKEQRIAVFEEVQQPNAPLQHNSGPAGQFSNVQVEESSLRQLIIVVLDMVNTPVEQQIYAKEQLGKFLSDPAHAGQAISLLTLNRDGVRLIHHFDNDPKELVAALNRVQRSQQAVKEVPSWAMLPQGSDKESTILEGFGQFQIESEQAAFSLERRSITTLTLQSMQEIAQAFAGLPGRKILVWASAGFPFTINETTMALKEGGAGLDTAANIVPLYERTWAALNQAQISVYPVDVRGLVNLPGPPPVQVLKEHLDPFTHGQWLQAGTFGTSETFAHATAGRVFKNQNGLEEALQQATDDSASYYLLGYYLDREDKKPGWRKLSVSVDREGSQVLARTGFFLKPPGLRTQDTSQDEMQIALDSPLDYTAIQITAKWQEVQATPEPKKKKAIFTLTMPPSFAAVDESDQNHFAVDFWAMARSQTGAHAGDMEQTMEGHFKPETLERFRNKGTDYRGALLVAPGDYQVRFVVRDRLSGRIGTVAAPLKVAP
ncbi:MAG: VWA domain-containing protein [Terriglobales bacterium]